MKQTICQLGHGEVSGDCPEGLSQTLVAGFSKQNYCEKIDKN